MSARLVLIRLFVTVAIPARMAASWVDPCENNESTAFPGNHDAWAAVLADYVHAGTKNGITTNLVDYAALRSDPSGLRFYLSQLCDADIASMANDELLAFWLNAYNAAMMTMLVIYDPITGVPFDDVRMIGALVGGQVWDHPIVTVAGGKLSPGTIEHRRIRANSAGDLSAGAAALNSAQGRVHSAMNCAAVSCPSLSAEPFRARNLQAHLSCTTTDWLQDQTKNSAPVGVGDGGNVSVSAIFSWFSGDFVSEAGSVHQFLKEFAPGVYGELTGSETIKDESYDWAVNDWAGSTAPSPAQACPDMAMTSTAPDDARATGTFEDNYNHTDSHNQNHNHEDDHGQGDHGHNSNGGGSGGSGGGSEFEVPEQTMTEVSAANALATMSSLLHIAALPFWLF